MKDIYHLIGCIVFDDQLVILGGRNENEGRDYSVETFPIGQSTLTIPGLPHPQVSIQARVDTKDI